MKKLIITTLLVLSANFAHAGECPPPSALWHPKQNNHWKLDNSYVNKGWYVSSYPFSDTVNLNSLGEDAWLDVKLISNEDSPDDKLENNNWFATCKYTINDGRAFPRYVILANNQLFKLNTQTAVPANFNKIDDGSEYQCSTTGKNTTRCVW